MLNTSSGREQDEQHCFFAGHLIAPNIAFEYDSFQPLGPDNLIGSQKDFLHPSPLPLRRGPAPGRSLYLSR